MNKSFIILISVLLFTAFSFQNPPKTKKDPDFLSLQNKWVDSVFNTLTPNQRLGQLFMVAAYSKNAIAI